MAAEAAVTENSRAPIKSECPLFVCRCCRTKQGWPHQSWCTEQRSGPLACEDCHYQIRVTGRCGHPGSKREERAAR